MALVPETNTLLRPNLPTLQYVQPSTDRNTILFFYRSGSSGINDATPYRFTAGGTFERVPNDEIEEETDFEGSLDNRPGATLFEGRLVVGGGPRKPGLDGTGNNGLGDDQAASITGSRTPDETTGKSQYFNLGGTNRTASVGDLPDADDTVVAGAAVNYAIESDLPMQIMWLTTFYSRLVIGTNLGIWFLHGLRPDVPPADLRRQSRAGANHVRPVSTPLGIAYVGTDGRRVYVTPGRLIARDSWAESSELTVYAEHITAAGVKELAWQQTPEERLWALMNDGTLACFCSHSQTGVAGWARMPTPFPITSIAVQPGFDGPDVLWALMAVSTAPRRHSLVRLTGAGGLDWQAERAISPPEGGRPRHVVLPASVPAGTPVRLVDRLTTPYTTFDTAARGDDDGCFAEAPLGTGATLVVGMPFEARMQLLQLSNLDGPAFGQPKRTARVVVGLNESTGGRVGPMIDRLRDIEASTPGVTETGERDVLLRDSDLSVTDQSLWIVHDTEGRFEVTYIAAEVEGG